MTADLEIHCRSYNGTGSVTHYYHFYFACLLPLIHFRLLNPLPATISLATPIGSSFEAILDELSLNISHSSSYPSSFTSSFHPQKILLPSYDIYDNRYYHTTPTIPSSTREMILNYLQKLILQKSSILSFTNADIILIERDSSGGDHTSTGYTRRHIRNHQQLKSELTLRYGSHFQNIYLERINFFQQFFLFHSSSIIIAQHGAALANIFFMNSMRGNSCQTLSHVIEISPPYSRRAQYFYNLANSLSISYSSIYQHRNRGNVSIPEVISHVECILSSWKSNVHCDSRYLGRKCGDIVGDFQPGNGVNN